MEVLERRHLPNRQRVADGNRFSPYAVTPDDHDSAPTQGRVEHVGGVIVVEIVGEENVER